MGFRGGGEEELIPALTLIARTCLLLVVLAHLAYGAYVLGLT